MVDYTKEDFTKNGKKYDIIFDTVNKSSFSACKNSLADHGRYLQTVGGLREFSRDLWSRFAGDKRFVYGMSVDKRESLRVVADLAKRGELKPVLDQSYDFAHIVDAHRYVELGHKKAMSLSR